MSNDPNKQGSEPEVVLLYCQHCVSGDDKVTAEADRASGFSVQPVMMPCSSKIEVPYILKIIERGADAVEVVACPPEACRFLVGSLRVEKRIEYIRGLLDEVHVGAERVGISRGPGLSAENLMALAAGRAEAVEALGLNPMKEGDVQ